MSSLSMDTKASHSNGDLCCPPRDNAASLKQVGEEEALINEHNGSFQSVHRLPLGSVTALGHFQSEGSVEAGSFV